ncbi:hypothetical protein SAMN05519104_7741 [Rhizobiales bacterium GAS188]|nr:hypothetical protein SAMN05519104_7741 [Rhizobiales bacterium GAS188]
MLVFTRVGLAAPLFLISGAVAQAGESAASLIAAGMPASCADFAANVSGSEGNFTSTSPTVNGVTCYGAFQFCSAPGSSVGGTYSQYNPGMTPAQFLADPSAQVSAWQSYETHEWNRASANGLTTGIGQTLCYQGQCAVLTQSSILKACQFGCDSASQGALAHLVSSGMNCDAPGTRDGAGTSVCKYLISGANQDVSCITNSSDTNSAAACPVGTVPNPNYVDPYAISAGSSSAAALGGSAAPGATTAGSEASASVVVPAAETTAGSANAAPVLTSPQTPVLAPAR